MKQSAFLARECCPACAASAATTLYRTPYSAPPLLAFLNAYYRTPSDLLRWVEDGIYQADRCDCCGLVFQRYVADEALLDALYDTWVNSSYDPEQDGTFLRERDRPALGRDGHELLAVSAALGKAPAALRVLDYGMGWGLWSQIAIGLGVQTFGFDFSSVRRAYGESRGVGIVSVSDIPSLDLDFINTEQVFEHLSQPFEVAATLAAGLRPGGILKISVPRADDIARRLRLTDWFAPKYSRNSLHPLHPLEHVNCFGPRALEQMTARAGLSPMSCSIRAYYSFITVPGATPWTEPKRLAKALARPLYHRFSRDNLYMWFRKS